MFELITAIAVWCGPPVYFKHAYDIRPKDVKKCRKRIVMCMTVNGRINHYSTSKIEQCFLGELKK